MAPALDQLLATHASLPLPTSELEDWRYGRIDALDLAAFAPPPFRDAQVAVEPGNGRAAVVELVDGRLVASRVDHPGVTVTTTTEVGELRGPAADGLDQLHDALSGEAVVVTVAPGVVVTEPVLVTDRTATDGGATFPHVVVRAGADSEVSVELRHVSADVHSLVVPQVEIDVAPAARVRLLEVQELGPRVWQLGRQTSRVGADASFTAGMVALGGHYARLAIESRLDGRGASGELLAVSFGEGDQMHDFRTLEDHVAPNTTSNMLFKGAVQDHSRAVYTGLIHIGKGARGSRAFQTNRNVKLSEGAWAESVPNLEIENNDVKCSHASAVGPVDEEQLFYLESRGLPTAIAERLVVLGFFEEVLERLPVPSAMPAVRAELSAKLDRRQV
ncbi:MAG TPA: Fe-S cluster assembly protein SufD [Acidimicrobiales bacterium]